jgi:RNA polymerase sigma-70 factor (ECF subfamily)
MSDPAQFESFVRNYQNMVYSTALRLLGNETEAEDMAQEAFLRAYQHFGELQNNPAAAGWLKTTTRNLCLTFLTRYRAKWRLFSELERGDVQTEAEPGGLAARLPAPDTREQDQLAADQRQILAEALQKLPPAQRVPLVLHYFEDLRYDEIARQLKVSLGKVKTDIHRARAALRHKLERLLARELESRIL